MIKYKETFSVGYNDKGFLSLVAARDYEIEEVVLNLTVGEFYAEGTFRTIDIGDCHVDHPFGRYTNHSCNPNTKVDQDGGLLVAISEIKEGEEITFNYKSSERKIVNPFRCFCGDRNCDVIIA